MRSISACNMQLVHAWYVKYVNHTPFSMCIPGAAAYRNSFLLTRSRRLCSDLDMLPNNLICMPGSAPVLQRAVGLRKIQVTHGNNDFIVVVVEVRDLPQNNCQLRVGTRCVALSAWSPWRVPKLCGCQRRVIFSRKVTSKLRCINIGCFWGLGLLFLGLLFLGLLLLEGCGGM